MGLDNISVWVEEPGGNRSERNIKSRGNWPMDQWKEPVHLPLGLSEPMKLPYFQLSFP